jgi:outer membrane receptor protein involved in Fe transport
MTRNSDRSQWKSVIASFAVAISLLIAGPLLAQDAADEATDEDSADLGRLEVTGTRIKRLDVEGPSPIVVVTREDIEARGFATVYEALEELPQNTGTLQGEQFTNTFTPNAQSLSLRSLGGGRTLVLLNGRRVADYPQPFNSQSNFFNFATIPAAAIERVEVLTGSASAVYGSDAVAGVINIILRDDVTAPTLTLRAGQTKDGGGDSELVSFVWGKQWDRASLTIAAEHQDMDPIFGKDRDYLDSVEDAPQSAGKIPFTRSALILSNWYGAPGPEGVYYDPGEQTCLDMQSEGVPYVYAYRDGRGNYCGRDDFGDETIQNERDRNSVYVNFKAELTDSMSFYTDVMYWDSSASLQGFHNWWGGDVWDPNIVSAAGFAGDWTYVQRVFHPNETGNQESTFDETATNATIGLEGAFPNFWNWEVGATYSYNDYEERQWRFKEEVADAYFGGTSQVDICIPLLGFACDFFQPDYSTAQFTVYDTLSQADMDAVSGQMAIDSDASVWSAFAEFDGDLMEMKHGPLQFAAVLEFASQEYDITPDERLLDQTGNGWWGLSGTGGGGDRDRSAVGLEFGIPVTEKLQATLAGRYDNYDDDSDVGGAATYGIGLEYRPIESLLLRSSFNTSFRAPDMHYLYADESGFFSSTRDIYQCRQEAIDLGIEYNELDCDFEQFAGVRAGNLGLAEEEGESFTIGFVYSPDNNFSIQLDYFELELDDAVRDLSTQQLARDEADCQLGVTTTGEAVDINSEECQDTLRRLTREPDPLGTGEIQDFDTFFIGGINTSKRKQTGFDAAMDYLVETDNIGDFGFRVDYTHVLSDERQLYKEDPLDKDFRDDKQNFNARSTVNVAATWDYKKFSGLLYAHRLGSMPNWQETDRLGSWTTFNGSATMLFLDDKLTASLLVNNLTDKRPPVDDGFTTWPFYWRGQYNARGRETFLQLRYTFE